MEIITKFKSANFSDRKFNLIDSFVFHSTEIPFKESLNMLCGQTERQVSSHYLIDFNGKIYQLVDPKYKAWHAGESSWRNREGMNEYSIGFELVDTEPSGERKNFTSSQMSALISLCNHLIQKFPISQQNVVAHSDIAPERKTDPGRNFDWQLLAKNGIGIYYNQAQITKDKTIKISFGDSNYHVYTAKKLLNRIGYKVDQTDKYDEKLLFVIQAFKSRFYQDSLSDEVNVELFEIMNNLAFKFDGSN